MWDPFTKRSKGFGFVTFTKVEEAGRAIAEFNGQMLGSRRLRCDWAQHKLVRTQGSKGYDWVGPSPSLRFSQFGVGCTRKGGKTVLGRGACTCVRNG